MVVEMEDKIKKLADEHWKWLEELLKTMNTQEYYLDTLEYIYKTAFIHGAKHQRELYSDDNTSSTGLKEVKEKLLTLERVNNELEKVIREYEAIVLNCK